MSLQEHIQKLHRIAHQMIADRMQTEELIGAALDGSSATGRIWETSDVDFSIFPVRSQHEQSVEWRVYEDMLAHVHVTSKKSTDSLIENYPHSFIESAKSGNFTSDPTWFLDGLSIMSIVHDPTGYLGEIKKFVATHRFAPEVLKERLRLMMGYVNKKLAEAGKMLTNEDYDSFLRLLYNGSGLACSMAHIWLEAHSRIYSGKEQDLQLGEVAQEAKLPEVHELYRAILGVDIPDEKIEAMLAPIDEYAAIIDSILQTYEESAMEQRKLDAPDTMESHHAYRLWIDLSFRAIPIAFHKRCYAHIPFTMNKMGPKFLNIT